MELILARTGDADRDYLQLALRREMGKVRTMFRVNQPEPGATASSDRLARAIRAAVDRGVEGLIVEPRDEPAVIDAVYHAVGRGVAVLLLDRAIPPRDGKTIPRVEFVAVDDVCRQIARGPSWRPNRNFHRHSARSGRRPP